MRNFLLVAIIAAALAGCSTTPTTEAPVEDRGTAGATAPGAGGAETGGAQAGGVTGAQLGGAAALRDPNNILSKRSVYFDFDSFVVKDEFKPLGMHRKPQLGYSRCSMQRQATLLPSSTNSYGAVYPPVQLQLYRAATPSNSLPSYNNGLRRVDNRVIMPGVVRLHKHRPLPTEQLPSHAPAPATPVRQPAALPRWCLILVPIVF
jgi:uncharacterized protein YceK